MRSPGLLDSLRHYWRTNAAVVGAAAVATAVLTGALVVGDSMRGSLRDLTLERLGEIDHALLSESFFRQQLAASVRDAQSLSGVIDAVAPAVLLPGSALHADSGERSSKVSLWGVEASSLAGFFPAPELALERADGQFFASVVLNRSLQAELGAEVGDQVVLSLARPSDVPRESLLGSTDAGDVVQSLRAVVRGVVPDRGLGRLGLMPHQSLPLNAFVDLSELQDAIDQPGRINALFISATNRNQESSVEIDQAVLSLLEVEDFGLETTQRGDVIEVTSREILLRPALEEAIETFADEAGFEVLRISTYLANRSSVLDRAASLPYSTITAMDLVSDAFGSLELIDGSALPALDDSGVLLNSWAAQDLSATVGDVLSVEYWEVGDREELISRTKELEIRGIVALSGLGADRYLTPPFPGVHDADNMSDWEPTFPVDLSKISSRDEDYWDRYRATPKLFVSEGLGRSLWGGRFGDLSAIRLATSSSASSSASSSPESSLSGSSASAAGQILARLRAELPSLVDSRGAGLSVLPVKEQGLRAAKGATDFAMLFVGFSLFLIAAAVLLVALFFRLGIERRAKEVGARFALGFPVASVRRSFVGEGTLLSALGAALGMAAAVGYAALMMAGLRHLWIGAVGTPFLRLHIEPGTLMIGAIASLAVVLLSIWRTVRRLARESVTGLLKGAVAVGVPSGGSRTRWIAGFALVVAIGLYSGSFFAPTTVAPVLFIGLGAMLLIAGLAGFSLWLKRPASAEVQTPGPSALLRMAATNLTLNPGRSLMSAALVACACFVIVAVGAYGHRFGEEVREIRSGAGGFSLVAESDVPIFHQLNQDDGRFELGFSEQDSAALAAAEIVPFRVLPGDDVSCLNLYRPERPRVLGVPDQLIERGGFRFQQVASEVENPWELLEEPFADGAIPAIGDFNSVMWILKSALGKDVEMVDERGQPIRLRLVGLLRRSLFQSELLISERLLLKHFPSRSGYQFFLVDPEEGEEQRTAASLERTLGRYGFDVSDTAQRLQSFQAVENTYLGTFQALGGLGLLLGTIGLGVVLLRSVLERAAELATLRAVGFRRSALSWTVVSENALVLIAGLIIGAGSALVAVSPHLRGGQALVPWGSLAMTLLAVFVVGLLACVAAVRVALRIPLLPALRAD